MDNFIFSILILFGLFYTCNRYSYWINVAIYTIYKFVYLAFFATNYAGTLFSTILSSFVVSLIYIKILYVIKAHINNSIWFVVIALLAKVALSFIVRMIFVTLYLIVSL